MNSFAYAHLDESLATKLIAKAGLGDIDQKVRDGERLSEQDGIRLYETPHLTAVGLMAHRVRTKKHGRPSTWSSVTRSMPKPSASAKRIALKPKRAPSSVWARGPGTTPFWS